MKTKAKKQRTSNKYEFLSCSDTLSDIVTDINAYSWWLFGVPKIGKTSLAAQFDKARIAATEQGHKSQRVYKEDLFNKPWLAYMEFLDYMRETTKYNTSVIDVLEKAHDACFLYMKEEVLEIEGEPQWGEWNEIRKPFIKWCKDLMSIPGKGSVFISHASSREVEDSTGEKLSSIHPNLTGKTLTAIEGEVDIIAYYTFINGHRVLQIQGDDYVRAGNRLTENFLDEKGEPLKYIPLGTSAKEGYNNILRAFENEQLVTHLHHVFPPKEPKATTKKPKKKTRS
jgi:hypothetical protein